MPTSTGFGALLASCLPEPWRYDENVRAVCLRIADVADALAPMRPREERAEPSGNHVDPGLTANVRGLA